MPFAQNAPGFPHRYLQFDRIAHNDFVVFSRLECSFQQPANVFTMPPHLCEEWVGWEPPHLCEQWVGWEPPHLCGGKERFSALRKSLDSDQLLAIPVTKIHLRFIIQPMNIPVATPIVIPVAMPIENVAITVSTGCRCRRLIVSSTNSSAVSPPCFAIRRVAPKLSSSASARAVVAREACRAASATRSPVHSTTDCAMIY